MMTLQKTTNSKENFLNFWRQQLIDCHYPVDKISTTQPGNYVNIFYIGGAGGRFVEYLICKYKGLDTTRFSVSQQNEYNDSIKVKDISVDIKTHHFFHIDIQNIDSYAPAMFIHHNQNSKIIDQLWQIKHTQTYDENTNAVQNSVWDQQMMHALAEYLHSVGRVLEVDWFDFFANGNVEQFCVFFKILEVQQVYDDVCNYHTKNMELINTYK